MRGIYLGLQDKTFTVWRTFRTALRAKRSHPHPNTEMTSSVIASVANRSVVVGLLFDPGLVLRSFAGVASLLMVVTVAQAQDRATGSEEPAADPLAAFKTDTGLISLTKAAPEATPVSDYGGVLWERSTAFGDVAGRQHLYDRGFTLDVEMTQVTQGLASGGPDPGPGTRYSGLLDYGLTLDTAKLGLWSGGLFVANAQTNWGRPLGVKAGNLSPTNYLSIYPIAGMNDSVLMEYYLIQTLPRHISLVVGRVNATNFLDKNRFANDPRNQFLNLAMNNDPLFGAFVSFSTYGVLLDIPVTEHIKIQPAIWDPTDQPGDYGGTKGFFDEVGVGSQVEMAWTLQHNLNGTLSPAFLYTTKNTTDLSNPRLLLDVIIGRPLPKKGDNYLFHVNVEQYLWKPDSTASREKAVRTADYDFQERGVGVFSRFGIAPESRNPYNVYLSGGIGGRGVFDSRPYDRFGIGVYWLKESNDLDKRLGVLNDRLGNLLGDEVGIEAFYNIALTPWLSVSGDLQWISTARTKIDNPLVLGMRVNTQF